MPVTGGVGGASGLPGLPAARWDAAAESQTLACPVGIPDFLPFW